MPRQHRQILPFRIPFFRIFYSTTYTIVFLVTLLFLAITPASLLFEAIRSSAYQYVFMVAGVYFLTLLTAILIYSSRLYTGRTVLAGVGKAYVPIEEGEIGNSVRKMIVRQLERSAIIAWESKPRDIKGEIAFAGRKGSITIGSTDDLGKVETIGTIVPVDVQSPPWGDIQHPGWTAPSDAVTELQSDLQFDVVISELPNLLEARAVSLAPIIQHNEKVIPDSRFLEILRRQEKMGMSEYLTQLSYLQLVDLTSDGSELLHRYERARFSGTPTTFEDFQALMLVFGSVMDNMKNVSPAIAEEIQAQVRPSDLDYELALPHDDRDLSHDSIGGISPVTARTRVTTPYLSQGNVSADSIGSVVQTSQQQGTPLRQCELLEDTASAYASSADVSDMDSVLRLPVDI